MKYLAKTQVNIIKNPCIDLQLIDKITGKRHSFEALIDTGFDGWICFDIGIAQVLDLNPLAMIKTINTDGQAMLNPVFELGIEFGSLDLPATNFLIKCIAKAHQKDEVIIGSKLLDYLCRSNKVKLSLDYLESEIYFEDIG